VLIQPVVLSTVDSDQQTREVTENINVQVAGSRRAAKDTQQLVVTAAVCARGITLRGE
jgi:hypothetical protein